MDSQLATVEKIHLLRGVWQLAHHIEGPLLVGMLNLLCNTASTEEAVPALLPSRDQRGIMTDLS